MILSGSWLLYDLRDRFEGSSLIEIEYYVKQMVEMSINDIFGRFLLIEIDHFDPSQFVILSLLMS